MKKKKLGCLTALAMVVCFSTILVSAKGNQLTIGRNSIKEFDEKIVDSTSFVTYNDIQQSSTVNQNEVIEQVQGEISQEKNSIASIGTSTKYGWDSGTEAYNFTQQWTSNHEIYSTYPYYNDGSLYPAATSMLNNPKGSADYSNAVREGYVDDEWAKEVGLHAYYHTISSDKLNSITVLLDSNVAFQVYDTNFNPVLNTSSTAYDNLLLYQKMSVRMSSGDKVVHTLKLKNGNYYIMFAPSDGTGNSHYALYTGNPLPIKQSYTASESTHNGSVKWDGKSTSQTYQCPSVSISISSGAELFSLKKVLFQDFTASINNAYVSSVEMMYQSPNSYSYKTVATRAGLRETMVDNYPDSGSIVGTYNTKVKVNWMSGLSYVNASYFTLTMMSIEYLVPFGEVSVTF